MAAGWNIDTQIREEVGFTDGRIYVRGKIHARGKRKRADHILYYKPNIPIAIIEAKDNNHTMGAGMQQALGYADAKTRRSARALPRAWRPTSRNPSAAANPPTSSSSS